MADSRRRPGSARTRGVVISAASLLLALTLAGCESDKVPIDSPTPGSDAQATRCRALLDALPDTVFHELRRSVDPEDALGAAWGDPAITLTCGGDMPSGFDRFSTCEVADGVGWYADEDEATDQSLDATLTTVGYEPVVSVRLPATYRPEGIASTMVALAPAIKRHLRLVEPCV
ncbi:MAG: DUF3515 domain-containing protein [Nocardioidaceae bacterium]